MDWKIEVVNVPVSDIDRAKAFYTKCGFPLDYDAGGDDGRMRVVQFTPPGSGCSIVVTNGDQPMKPGSLQGVQIVVSDVAAARDQLVAGGVDATPVRHFENGEWKDGPGGPWNSFVFFSDPDGNGWVIQERPASE